MHFWDPLPTWSNLQHWRLLGNWCLRGIKILRNHIGKSTTMFRQSNLRELWYKEDLKNKEGLTLLEWPILFACNCARVPWQLPIYLCDLFVITYHIFILFRLEWKLVSGKRSQQKMFVCLSYLIIELSCSVHAAWHIPCVFNCSSRSSSGAKLKTISLIWKTWLQQTLPANKRLQKCPNVPIAPAFHWNVTQRP